MVVVEDELAALRAEIARLAQENAELHDVLQQIPVAITIKDRDSRFLFANPPGALGYGLPAEQLVGRLEREVFPAGNEAEEHLAADRAVIDTGEPRIDVGRPFVGADGTRWVLTINRLPVRYARRRAVMIAAFDLTELTAALRERSALERRVLETQRLESLGLMAGGIAHDFNNLLVGVLANADLALGQPGVGPNVERSITRIKAAAQRLATLCRQMLAYSGRAHFESAPLDLCGETRALLDLLEASLPKQARIATSLPDGVPPVMADATQLRQVIMNLITNAAEAIGERSGTVRVSVEDARFDPGEHGPLTLGAELPAGRYACMTVRDDGGGMTPRTLERLFDPFFSTKGAGRGLGLAAVLGIVRGHGGALAVRSQPGHGTTIRVWLPASERVSAEAAAPSGAPPDPGARAAAVRALVVDDEPMVLSTAGAILEAAGMRVDTAAHGAEAIETVRRTPDLDVILLDLTMPGMSATDTLAAIRALRADLPIVLTSGFSEQEVRGALLGRPGTTFLPKPYTADELVDGLHRAIQGPRGRP